MLINIDGKHFDRQSYYRESGAALQHSRASASASLAYAAVNYSKRGVDSLIAVGIVN